MNFEVIRLPARWVAAMAGCALLGACANSYNADTLPLRSNDPIPATAASVAGPAVSGTVVDGSGAPVPGATVVVAVALSGAEQFFHGAAGLASAGILCAVGVCSAPEQHSVSAADGSFALALPHNEGKDNYYLAVGTARGAGQVGTRLTLPKTDASGAAIGTVLLADGAPRISTTAGLEHLTPPTLPAAVPVGATVVTAESAPARTNSLGVSRGYDRRLLEDQPFTLASTQAGTYHGFPAVFSSSLPVQGADVPMSRGAACALGGPGVAPVVQNPCALTDGTSTRTTWTPDYGSTCPNGSCPSGQANPYTWVEITLPKAVRTDLIVARGCISQCTIAVSSDGRSFTQVGAQPFGSADSMLATALSARTIRSVRLGGPFLVRLTQLSVFAAQGPTARQNP